MPLPLHRGSSGSEVNEIQELLGMVPDGDYGPLTEAAIKVMQRTLGITIDGVVGKKTWDALHKLPPIPPKPKPKPVDTSALDVEQITEIAGEHKIARYNWPGRGRAPLGYTKGVAVSFALAVLAYRADYLPALSMARAAPCSSLDALAWYGDKFAALKMSNNVAGEDTLRHLFALVLGLGMRESSGKHCTGRDLSARNTSSATCEAGAFQMSWDAHAGVPLLRQLLNDYHSDGYVEVYSEGVKCSKADWRCLGDGTGHDFQVLCKEKPDFSAQACALGLRTLRTHWGPINRREVTLSKDADDMLHEVQDTLK
jgi:hypothetical protein